MSYIISQAIKECVNEYTEMIIDEYHLRTDLQIASIKRVEQKVLAKMAKEFIDQRPTADVVEVVRCKACVHGEHRNDGNYDCWHINGLVGGNLSGTEYCSFGERREKEE